jgi:putative hydrolase of the HAD superfamily
MANLQAVFFDMGGTIETYWFDRELRLKATPGIQKHLLAGGIDLCFTNEQLYQVIASGLNRYKDWKDRSLIELPPARVWRDFILTDFHVDPNRLDAIAEELMFWVDMHYYAREMRPEMPRVLEALKTMGLKLGVISNIDSCGQVPTNLESYGIRDYFDPVVLSCEYGRRKPDPAIFHYAARLANVPAGRCLYVGDSSSQDICGAHRAGFRYAIQIRNDFTECEECLDDPEAIPDLFIERMDELVDFIAAKASPENVSVQWVGASNGKIAAILFDAGDVLYYRPGRGKKLAGFLYELGLDPGGVSSDQKFKIKEQALIGRMSQDEYREAHIRLYGITQPEIIERGKNAIEQEDNDIHFFDGVRETLAELKNRGFLLAIVTDTAFPVSVKLGWLEQGGFGSVWDAVISSNEIGIHKPDPEIYWTALRQLGVLPGQAAFVGHMGSELDGAKATGLTTIAFNYGDSVQADFYTQNFSDLLSVPGIASPGLERSFHRNGSPAG